MSIPGLDAWLESPQGRYVIAWEQAQVDRIVNDVFGYNALQIGLPQRDFLRANRIPLRQKAGEFGAEDVLCELVALPFASQSIDLVVLPHVLEFHADPHQLLREIERVLMPEGQLVIVGFNPLSLWGATRRLKRRKTAFPWNGHYLSVLRTKDWLKLLGFEIDRGAFGVYRPPCETRQWLRRWRFMELAGDRWWGFAGGVYVLRAIKRVHGMRLIEPKWKTQKLGARALRPISGKLTHQKIPHE